MSEHNVRPAAETKRDPMWELLHQCVEELNQHRTFSSVVATRNTTLTDGPDEYHVIVNVMRRVR